MFSIACYSPLSMRVHKQCRAGQERARVRNAIAQGNYELAEMELAPWNEWDCPRDGKQYRPEWDGKMMRK